MENRVLGGRSNASLKNLSVQNSISQKTPTDRVAELLMQRKAEDALSLLGEMEDSEEKQELQERCLTQLRNDYTQKIRDALATEDTWAPLRLVKEFERKYGKDELIHFIFEDLKAEVDATKVAEAAKAAEAESYFVAAETVKKEPEEKEKVDFEKEQAKLERGVWAPLAAKRQFMFVLSRFLEQILQNKTGDISEEEYNALLKFEKTCSKYYGDSEEIKEILRQLNPKFLPNSQIKKKYKISHIKDNALSKYQLLQKEEKDGGIIVLVIFGFMIFFILIVLIIAYNVQ